MLDDTDGRHQLLPGSQTRNSSSLGRPRRPPDSMRAGPSKKELQKSVKEMKLAAVDMGGSRMSDDI